MLQRTRSCHKKSNNITRARIIQAAKKVFARHPYNAASIRMIGAEGGFDHPLINYYFPSKSKLFETVIADVCEEYYTAAVSWYEGLDVLGLEEGFSLYLDRLIEYNRKKPELFRIISLNLSQAETAHEIPGYSHIIDLGFRTREVFANNLKLRASSREIDMFTYCFYQLLTGFLGASSFLKKILEVNPKNRKYYEWVKGAILYLFLPAMKRLMHPDSSKQS